MSEVEATNEGAQAQPGINEDDDGAICPPVSILCCCFCSNLTNCNPITAEGKESVQISRPSPFVSRRGWRTSSKETDGIGS